MSLEEYQVSLDRVYHYYKSSIIQKYCEFLGVPVESHSENLFSDVSPVSLNLILKTLIFRRFSSQLG